MELKLSEQVANPENVRENFKKIRKAFLTGSFLPDQAGNAGKFLTTNGTLALWATVSGGTTSVFGRTGAVIAQSNDYTWSQIDKTISSLADIATRSASDINSGTLSNSRLTADVTLMGNVFNGPSQLVLLDSGSRLPAVDGSLLTGIIPSQTGNTGKFVTTDGSVLSWADAGGSTSTGVFYLGEAINGGGTSAYSATIPEVTALAAGQIFFLKFRFSATSTAATFNLNGYGVKSILKNGTAITNGTDFGNNSQYSILEYDGANFQLIGNNMSNVAYKNGWQTFTSNNSFNGPVYINNTLGTAQNDWRSNIWMGTGTGYTLMDITKLKLTSANMYARVMIGSGQTGGLPYNSDGAGLYVVCTVPGTYSSNSPYNYISSLAVKTPVNATGIIQSLQAAYFDDAPTAGIRNWSINAGASLFRAGVTIESTTEGFLPPRMTTTQKGMVVSPIEGLIVYDLTLHKLCVFTGSVFETITSS